MLLLPLLIALGEWFWWHLASFTIGAIAASVARIGRLRPPLAWSAALMMVVFLTAYMSRVLPDLDGLALHIGIPAALGAFISLASAFFGLVAGLVWLQGAERRKKTKSRQP